MVEVLALEIDLGAAAMARQPLGEVERARPPDIMGEQAVELGMEFGIVLRLLISALELEQKRHQRLGDVTPAIGTEMAARIGTASETVGARLAHAAPSVWLV